MTLTGQVTLLWSGTQVSPHCPYAQRGRLYVETLAGDVVCSVSGWCAANSACAGSACGWHSITFRSVDLEWTRQRGTESSADCVCLQTAALSMVRLGSRIGFCLWRAPYVTVLVAAPMKETSITTSTDIHHADDLLQEFCKFEGSCKVSFVMCCGWHILLLLTLCGECVQLQYFSSGRSCGAAMQPLLVA
jgi:hypothetical protein